MHGLILHQRDRAKAELFGSVDAGTRAMLELQFREYVAAISELVALTALVLQKVSIGAGSATLGAPRPPSSRPVSPLPRFRTSAGSRR